MFLHLSHDEKFIDSARVAFEDAAPGMHAFIVVDSTGPLKYIQSFEPRRMTIGELLDPSFLSTLPTYDAVFLHSLNKPNRLIVDRAPSNTRFVWIGWGYDYYGLICTSDELLLPQTRALMEHVRDDAKASSLAANVKAAILSPQRLLSGLRSRHIGPGGRDEYALLQKIAFFVPVLPTEDELVRSRHPDFQPRYGSWNYGAHEILDSLVPFEGTRLHRVIVGNSATPECNHLESFDALACFDGDVMVPLSYGNADYRDKILRAGRTRFGYRFRPLTDFLTTEAYIGLISASSHLMMNHLRQQGFTNVLIALQAGTRVAMRRDNPLFPYLVGLGFQIDDIADGLAAMPLAGDVVAHNRARVSEQFGADRHHIRTSEFLNEVGRKGGDACTA